MGSSFFSDFFGSNGKRSTWATVLMVIIVILAIAALLAVFAFQGLTLISLWKTFLFSLVIALASGTVLWRLWIPLNANQNLLPNLLIHTIFFTLILWGGFYTLNFTIASSRQPEKVQAYILEKYSEFHSGSNSSRRKYGGSTKPHYEYYIKVRFDNGFEKDIALPSKTYKAVRSKSDITLSVAQGIFGIGVVRPNDILDDNPQFRIPKKRKGRCRFFGTHGK